MPLIITIDNEAAFGVMLRAVAQQIEVPLADGNPEELTAQMVDALGQAFGFTGDVVTLHPDLDWLPAVLGPASRALWPEAVSTTRRRGPREARDSA